MTLEVEEQSLSYRAPEVFYPDSDGERMADNTLQFEWIVTIKEGLEYLFRDDPNVFVAGDLLWYPVEGNNTISHAPDAMVVFGRPKGYRGSYRQFQEGGVAPQVIFEVLSPSNTPAEMTSKRHWYAHYGAEEYYEYDPDRGKLRGWLLQGIDLVEIEPMQGWVSPRLGVTFGLEGVDLVLIGPDGKRFRSYLVLAGELDELAIKQAMTAAERNGALSDLSMAIDERDTAITERDELVVKQAETVAERDREREGRKAAEEMAARLAARLRELGIDP